MEIKVFRKIIDFSVLIAIILFLCCAKSPVIDTGYIDFEKDFWFHEECLTDWLYVNMILTDSLKSDTFASSMIIDNSQERMFYFHNIKDNSTYISNKIGTIEKNENVMIFKDSLFTDKLIRTGLHSFIYKMDEPGASCSLSFEGSRYPILIADTGIVLLWDSICYYYCIPRLKISGYMNMPQYKGEIKGHGWVDRQWGNFILGHEPYTWFSIFIENGEDIVVWKMHNTQKCFISIVEEDAFKYKSDEYISISSESVQVHVFSYIKNEDTGWVFPYGWRIVSNTLNIDLLVIPTYSQFEMGDENSHLYQGICSVEGVYNKENIYGKCYMEVTGYKTDNEIKSTLIKYNEEMFNANIKLLRDKYNLNE